MFDGWGQDVRYALRTMRRSPLFAVTAALSLAVGIGATTTMFTVARALLFRSPAGVADPERVVDIGRSQNGSGFDNGSYPNYLDLASRNRVFADVYAYRLEPQPMSVGGPDGAERIYGGMVTTNYFAALGTRAHAGRLFERRDSADPDASPIAVLSYRFWTRRFNADRAIVGQPIVLNGRPYTIVGVAPEAFQGTTVLAPDVWVPITMAGSLMPRGASLLTSRAAVWLVMGARLRPGVTLAQAQADATSIAAALEREFPDENRGKGFRVAHVSPVPGQTTPVAAFLTVLMTVAGLVLVIACVNLAGVLLARASSRRRELGVRLAIGAGRARLVRQLLVETTMLFLIGAAAGLELARAMTTALVALLPTLPAQVSLSLALDLRALLFATIVSLVAAVASGLAPALQAARSDVIAALKSDAGGGPERMRLRQAFVVAQVALSIVLVVGAGLFVRALERAASIDPGFDPHGVELASLDLSLGGYTDATGPAFASALIERVRAVPGVQDAALATVIPLGLGGLGLGDLHLPSSDRDHQRPLDADWNVISPRYFSTMKMPLAGGRDFTDADRLGTPWVAIVNETAARQWWPGQNPMGRVVLQEMKRPGQASTVRPLQIVGVARDAKYRSLGDGPRAFVFVPQQQQYLPRTTIVARSTHGQRLAADLRSALASMNPNVPVVTAQTLDDYAAIGLVPQRIAATVSGSLGIVGLLLASVGIYGITAYLVTMRMREIGIRLALGAQPADVLRLVLRQGMTLTIAGIIIGVALAAVAARAIASLLFGVGPADAVTFAAAIALFIAVGFAACVVPARRATAASMRLLIDDF